MQSEKDTLVSIAMTTFNGEDYLLKQLESLRAQDYNNIEIVVCDDGSIDGTVALLHDYRQSHPDFNLSIYQNEKKNLGYVKNFEQAISHCTGQYIALCDQDDIWMPNKLSAQFEQITKSQALAVYSDATLIDARDQDLGVGLWEAVIGKLPPRPISHKAFYISNCVTGCTMMIDRALLASASPFPDEVPHDWWLAYHAAYAGKLDFVNEKLICYRQHDNNVLGLGRAVRQTRWRLFWRHKRDKWNLNYQLVKYCRGFVESHARLGVMYDFECSTSGGASEELECLNKWIADKLRNRSLDNYRDFFNSDSEAFQLFSPAKLMLESFGTGMRRTVRQVCTNVVINAIAAFSLAIMMAYLISCLFGYLN